MPMAEVEIESRSVDGAAPLRCRILTTAERLFREIGYRKTTIADIGAALRMSPGNVYRFFPSKKALNEAVADRLLDQIAARLREIAAVSDVRPRERLRRLIGVMHEMSAGQFVANRRMHDMVEAAMAESWQVVHAHIDVVDQILCRLVAEGVECGDFAKQDPIVAARCVHTAIIRFCHPALIAQCADEVGPTVEEMTAFVLAALNCHYDAKECADFEVL